MQEREAGQGDESDRGKCESGGVVSATYSRRGDGGRGGEELDTGRCKRGGANAHQQSRGRQDKGKGWRGKGKSGGVVIPHSKPLRLALEGCQGPSAPNTHHVCRDQGPASDPTVEAQHQNVRCQVLSRQGGNPSLLRPNKAISSAPIHSWYSQYEQATQALGHELMGPLAPSTPLKPSNVLTCISCPRR